MLIERFLQRMRAAIDGALEQRRARRLQAARDMLMNDTIRRELGLTWCATDEEVERAIEGLRGAALRGELASLQKKLKEENNANHAFN